MKDLYEDVDYTQMSDVDVQKDLGILRDEDVVSCDIVADYEFIGDGETKVTAIIQGLEDFIKSVIGDESASIKVKGSELDGEPIYSASITSSNVKAEEAYDELKSADSNEYSLVQISMNEGEIYEENL